jgi:hypothetical protein
MKFMTLVKGPENQGMPPQALFDAVDELSREATEKGVMLEFGGLMPSSAGFTVRATKGKMTVTDGPFTEAKEVLGGYAVYDVKSKEEMLEWTRRFFQMHMELWPEWKGEVEVRQLWEMGPPDHNA